MQGLPTNQKEEKKQHPSGDRDMSSDGDDTVFKHLRYKENMQIFDKVDLFQAGTFKFVKNQHFTDNIQEFENKIVQQLYNKIYPNHRKPANGVDPDYFKREIQREKDTLKPHQKFNKTFIPIFPDLYENLHKNGVDFLGKQVRMNLFSNQTWTNPATKEDINIPKLGQIKFSIKDNVLLKYEETR